MSRSNPPEPSSTRSAVTNGLFVSVAVFAANASNFVFQIATGRLLSTSEYGLLLSALTLLGLISVVISATQAAISKREAMADAQGPHEPLPLRGTRLSDILAELRSDRLAMAGIRIGILGGAIAALASPLIADFLHAGTPVALALAASVPTLITSAIVYGRLQGRQQFVVFAVLSLAIALAKLAGGVTLAAVGGGTTGILLVIALSGFALAVAGLAIVRSPGPSDARQLMRETGRALIVMLCWRALLGMDIPLARSWLPSNTVGEYAAAAVIGRGILWLPEIVSFILFPTLAASIATGANVQREFRKALVLTLSLCAAGVIALWALGPTIFDLLYGARYPHAAKLSWKLALAALPNAATNLFLFAALARGSNRWVGALVGATVGQLGLLLLFHDSTDQLILCAAAGSFLALAATIYGSRSATDSVVAHPQPAEAQQ
jgi:O-antigen/teichoic acid export membrane protein